MTKIPGEKSFSILCLDQSIPAGSGPPILEMQRNPKSSASCPWPIRHFLIGYISSMGVGAHQNTESTRPGWQPDLSFF